jgi:stage V sporulation protein B
VGRVTLPSMKSDPPKPATSLADDATELAGGSAIVMAGGLVERAVRMLTTWFLSGVLGPAAFGLYAFATTVVAILGWIAPLGMDAGAAMYGARYRKTQEQEKLKGLLFSTLGGVAITGPVFAIMTWLLVRYGIVLADSPQEAQALLTISSAIALAAVLFVATFTLISQKDMVGQAWAQQITLPGATLVGAGLAIVLDHGVDGVMVAFVVAHALALMVALNRIWKSDGPLLRDTSIRPLFEWGPLLRYTIPQSFARVLYRANLWVDILMLTALASLTDVGVYRVSVALAMLGALPVVASTTMFGPVIAELIYTDQTARLNALLKVITRWLVVIATPLYFTILLLPDVILSIFDEAYQSGASALCILMIGQAVYVIAAPTGAILTNAGHSMLNLINGLIAVGLNIGLNAWLIPQLGIQGAAIASATALVVWSVLRLTEVAILHRCSPFSARSVVVVITALVLGVLSHHLLVDQSIGIRVSSVAIELIAGLAVFWMFGRTEEDDAVVDRVRARIGR